MNPSNPFVLLPHVECAAHELPLTPDDETLGEVDDAVRELVLRDRLVIRNGRAVHAGPGSPAPRVSLRSGSAEEFRVVDGSGRLIGTVDGARAFETVHPGAVYLHQGLHWRVARLDLDDRAAWVDPDDGDTYTQTRSTTDVQLLGVDRSTRVGAADLFVGPLEVTEQIVGYQRLAVGTGEVVERVELDLPPSRLVTRGIWYTLTDRVLRGARVAPEDAPGTLHAAEHAAIGILPLFAICDRWDVGGVSTTWLADTGRPTIVVYDGYPGGAGVAELAFDAAPRHLAATLDVIDACPCTSGCPSCVQSPKCGNWNEPLDKAGASRLLRRILR